MPDTTVTATTQGTTPAATGTAPVTNGEPQGGAEKAIPQSEVNALMARTRQEARERLLKELGFEKPEDLKARLDAARNIEDATKTEQQKTAERLAALEKEKAGLAEQNARLQREHTETLIRAAVVSKAAALGFHDPQDAYRLIDASKLKLTDAGEVEGANEALEAMSKAKPWLVQQTPRLSATNPAGGSPTGGETDAQRRARLTGKGGAFSFGEKGGAVYHE